MEMGIIIYETFEHFRRKPVWKLNEFIEKWNKAYPENPMSKPEWLKKPLKQIPRDGVEVIDLADDEGRCGEEEVGGDNRGQEAVEESAIVNVGVKRERMDDQWDDSDEYDSEYEDEEDFRETGYPRVIVEAYLDDKCVSSRPEEEAVDRAVEEGLPTVEALAVAGVGVVGREEAEVYRDNVLGGKRCSIVFAKASILREKMLRENRDKVRADLCEKGIRLQWELNLKNLQEYKRRTGSRMPLSWINAFKNPEMNLNAFLGRSASSKRHKVNKMVKWENMFVPHAVSGL